MSKLVTSLQNLNNAVKAFNAAAPSAQLVGILQSITDLISDIVTLFGGSISRFKMLGNFILWGGVALAAIAGDGLGEAFAGHLPSAAKHHVFEEMRHAGNAGGIIDRADLEPQNLGGDGGAVIGDHQHLQAVCERELEGLAATHVARR